MEFSPQNPVVKRCLQGMALEEEGSHEAAGQLYLQAWHEATNDFEKFLAAHYLARQAQAGPDKLKWLQEALQAALKADGHAVKTALPALYTRLAACYEELHDPENAEKHRELARSFQDQITDNGPFFHGTKADLQVGELLVPGNRSNYQSELIMNHIYFTALVNGAGLAAALAKGEGHQRVYVVEPTGSFENDPNVTDQKFPGNPTRSYRTGAPLKIVGEVTDWARQTPEELAKWQEKLASNQGKIIN